MVANIILYPYEYCLHQENRDRILAIAPDDPVLKKFVQILQDAQEKFSKKYRAANTRAIWANSDKYCNLINIETAVSASDPHFSAVSSQAHSILNMRILEGVVERGDLSSDFIPEDDAVSSAAACIWLSDHLALFVLGIAKLLEDKANTLVICAADENSRKHLRRVWFGNAFEEMSLRAASAKLTAFAYEVGQARLSREDLEELHIQTLCIFPQHWRLPVDDGPVSELMWDYLAPLVQILTYVLIAKERSSTPSPLRLDDAKKMNAGAVFEIVLDMQSRLPLVDRLFDVVDDGLVLGTRTLASGVIAVAEHIAAKVLGKDWNAYVSEIQKKYVIDRLSASRHIKVIDEELRQHDSENATPLDVDFFVKDVRHGKIYAVQLKHFEQSDRGGLLLWVARLRERGRNLGKAVKQLENFKNLVACDKKIQAKLNEIGFSTDEFSEFVPVVLHTVGTIDFWELQSGVLLHDIGTFCNILKGRSSSMIAAVDGRIIVGQHDGGDREPSLHQTDAVINAYTTDPKFARDLQHFDLSKKIARTLNLGNHYIVAKGLGI